MKYFFLITSFLLTQQFVFAQYPGPIMDSLKKYQELIEHAQTQQEKIQLALQLQKIMNGKSSIDTNLVKKMPTSREDALKQRDIQVAAIKKQQQDINAAKTRKEKYTAIQKVNGINDSIIAANKNAGKHSGLQPGLITLPNADQFTVDLFAHVDTSQVTVSFQYHREGHNKNGTSKAFFSGTSYTASMYKQNGIIIIRAINGQLPEYISKENTRFPIMVNHHDINGSASSQADKTVGASNQKFGFYFAYNPMSNVYEVSAGAGMIWTTPIEGSQPQIDTGSLGFAGANDPATMKIPGSSTLKSGGEKVAHFAKTQTGFAVQYSYAEDGIAEQFSAIIDLSPPRFEAFIEPADTAQYRKWLPQGPVLTNYPTLPNGGKGNDIQLKVTLWDRQTKKEAADMYTAAIKLNNVSGMPGYCMNYPQDDKEADDKPDMRFDKADSAIYETWSTNKLTTRKASGPQYVTVVSYDYGGFADVTADVTTPEGFTLKAHLRNSTMDTLTLPKRTNGSFVADYWKQLQGAEEKSDLADDEEIEVHDDRYPGDGLTLYEEYRGFLENRKHFRGNAEKKDLMACNKIKTVRSQDGINMCEAVLNQYGNRIYMHSRFRDDEFGTKQDPDADEIAKMTKEGVTTPMKYDRCINYNNIEILHITNQHGIVLMNSDKESGYAIAVAKTDGVLGPPKNMYFLVITKSFSPKPGAWSEIRGHIDDDGHITITPQGKFKILTDEYAVTVAHEMLHCYHVYHHGDDNDLGKWQFTYNNHRDHFDLTAKNGKELKVPQRIRLFWEDNPGTQLNGSDIEAVQAKTWHIVGENSNHSGVEDCIMRYDNSQGYTRTGTEDIYLMKTKKTLAELTGINICNSTIGTGVNSRTHKPISRYGDAAPGRGDCIHQFCVSDKYN